MRSEAFFVFAEELFISQTKGSQAVAPACAQHDLRVSQQAVTLDT